MLDLLNLVGFSISLALIKAPVFGYLCSVQLSQFVPARGGLNLYKYAGDVLLLLCKDVNGSQ